MAELALCTTEFYNDKEKYLAWRPKGSVIVVISDWRKRLKWLEICCDLVAPYKRDKYRMLPGWAELCAVWTPAMREKWMAAQKPTVTYPLGPLLQDKAEVQKLWDALVVPTGVVSGLPDAPESTVKVCNTWLWSDLERKEFFIVVNTDEADDAVEAWGQQKERLLFKTPLPTVPYVLEVQDPLPAGTYRVMAPSKVIDYETALSLSAGKLADIADTTKVVHPDFTNTVSKANVLAIDITKVPMPKK